jgi:hypothetical protein
MPPAPTIVTLVADSVIIHLSMVLKPIALRRLAALGSLPCLSINRAYAFSLKALTLATVSSMNHAQNRADIVSALSHLLSPIDIGLRS